MTREELVRMYSMSLNMYADYYYEEESRNSVGVSREEAAKGLLENFGMLYRYSGDEGLLQDFLSMPGEERYSLARDAMCYLKASPLPNFISSFCTEVLPSETQLAQMESALLRLDELSVIMDMIRSLAYDFMESDDEMHELFMELLSLEEAAERVLKANPDVVVVAGNTLRALGKEVIVESDPDRQWWLTERCIKETNAAAKSASAWLNRLAKHAQQCKASNFLSLSRRIMEERTRWSNSRVIRNQALLAASSGQTFYSILEEEPGVRVKITVKDAELHISVPTDSLLSSQLLGGCIYVETEGNLTKDIQLDSSSCASISWSDFPENARIGLKNQNGKSFGFLVPAPDSTELD